MMISSVNTSEGEVRYAECCSGPKPLVMMPGVSVTSVLGSAAAVEAAYKALDGTYTIYLFEYPGKYPEGAEIPYIADMMAEAIKALGLKDCCLLGASFGGMVGQVMLAEHPELFTSAVVCSTIAKLTDASPKTISRWHRIASDKDVRTLNLAFFDAVYSDEYQLKYAELIRKVLDNGNENDCRIMAAHTGMILRADLRPYDRKIKTPTLMVSSEQDHVFSPKDISDTAELIGCSTYVYEDYSHAACDEAPDFIQKMTDFFESHK